MGMCATARLIYGVDYGDENPFRDYDIESDDDGDFDDAVVAKYAPEIKAPTAEYSEESRAEYHAFWDAKRAVMKTIPFEIEYHGSDGYSCYALSYEPIAKQVDYGDSKELGQEIKADPAWREEFVKFYEKMGLEFKEPQFLLLAYWG